MSRPSLAPEAPFTPEQTIALSHAATVAIPGRTFLRRLIDVAKIAHRPHHFVRLSEVVQSDSQWQSCFLVRWNGHSLTPSEEPSVVISTDASGSWGCGALLSNSQWFQLQWPTSWEAVHIAAKELSSNCSMGEEIVRVVSALEV